MPNVSFESWCDNSLRVRVAPDTLPAAAQLAPAVLYRAVSGIDVVLCLSAECSSRMPVEGYKQVRTEGAAPQHSSIPLALFYSPLHDDSLTAPRGFKLPHRSYRYLCANGAARRDATSLSDMPLRIFYHRGLGRSITTASPEGISWAIAHNYSDLGQVGFISPASYANTRMLPHPVQDSPGALVDKCIKDRHSTGKSATNGNLKAEVKTNGSIVFSRVDDASMLFVATVKFAPSTFEPNYLRVSLSIQAGDAAERIYGLGQGNWTQWPVNGSTGCPTGPQRMVPLARNGQRVALTQRKFHISIPL